MEQDTRELEKYSALGVIVRGQVKAFVASFSTDDSSFELLDPKCALNQAMLRFVSSFVESQGLDFNTHLVIDFCVEDWVTATGVVKTILPVDISIQGHRNILLYQGISGSVQLTRAYLAYLQPADSPAKQEYGVKLSDTDHESPEKPVIPESKVARIYNFGEMVSQLVLKPLIGLLALRNTPKASLRTLVLLVDRLLHWTDDLYSIKDPVPFWWFHQVQVPLGIIMNVIRGSSVSSHPHKQQWTSH